MGANERGDPTAGPFGNLSQLYCNGLDQLAKGYEPAVRNAGRWNLELMGFFTRRSQAWLEIPARASQCKSPQDLAREQLHFWQTATRDYAEGVRRLTMAFGSFAGSGSNGAWGGETAGPARDYITFAEPKPGAADTPQRERRAA